MLYFGQPGQASASTDIKLKMNFKVGDKVVCIDNKNTEDFLWGELLIYHGIYTVVFISDDGNSIIVDNDVTYKISDITFITERFAPISILRKFKLKAIDGL